MAYNKNELYCLLGAEKFQKIVFLLEKGKYTIIEKFFPNIKEWYEAQLNRQFQKRVQKEPIENQKALLHEYQSQKLAFRKELVYKQNRNYHYNPNYPTRFIQYLEWNKKIHVKGLKKDIIALIGIGIASFLFGNPVPLASYMLVGVNLFSLVVNLSCINLQNYNLYRFQNEKMYSLLEKVEEKKLNQNLEKLGNSIVPVSKAITNQVELPTIEQVVAQISTKEEAQRLREYVKEQYTYLEQNQIQEKPKEKRK